MESMKLGSAPPTTAEKIREPKFKTGRRGYDPGQVLEYLSKVADRVQTLEEHARELDAELQDAVMQRDEATGIKPIPEIFESVSTRVAQLMTGLDADVEKIREDAKAEAGLIVLDAKAEASRIEAEAHARRNATDHALLQARSDAERETSEFRSRQESMRSELRATCSKVRQMVANLEEVIGEGQDQQPIVLEEAK
jgi:DivIVA domain-containing protein